MTEKTHPVFLDESGEWIALDATTPMRRQAYIDAGYDLRDVLPFQMWSDCAAAERDLHAQVRHYCGERILARYPDHKQRNISRRAAQLGRIADRPLSEAEQAEIAADDAMGAWIDAMREHCAAREASISKGAAEGKLAWLNAYRADAGWPGDDDALGRPANFMEAMDGNYGPTPTPDVPTPGGVYGDGDPD